jgi:hypothetical protein
MTEIKIGDWVKWRGERFIVIAQIGNVYRIVSKFGDPVRATADDFTHLPGCTGWDWKPPLELKEGAYYENASGEVVGPLTRGRDSDGSDRWEANLPGTMAGYWFHADGTCVTAEWSLVKEVPKPEVWRKATIDDACRAIHGEVVESRFRDNECDAWCDSILVGYDRHNNYRWRSMDGCFKECEVKE